MFAKICIAHSANSSSLSLPFKFVPSAFRTKPSYFLILQIGQGAGSLVLSITLSDLATRKILKASVNCQHFPWLLSLSFIIRKFRSLLLLQHLNFC